MPAEDQELRRINWTETFGFVQLFRTFRLAINPWKMLFALALLLSVYAAGRIIDGIWLAGGGGAHHGEVVAYANTGGDWSALCQQLDEARQSTLAGMLMTTGIEPDAAKAQTMAEQTPGEAVDKIHDKIRKDYLDARTAWKDDQDNAEMLEAVRSARAVYLDNRRLLDTVERHGPFITLLQYENWYVRQAIEAVRYGQFSGGLNELMKMRRGELAGSDAQVGLPGRMPFPGMAEVHGEGGLGFLACLAYMALGVKWMLCAHWLFAIVFLLVGLALASLFGGALCRMAALDAARDEKLGLREAWRFACGKFLSFATAPLIPLAGIVLTAVFMFLGGLLAGIPVVDVIAGVIWPLALIGGLVIAMLAVGLAGGGSLMFPTIAVEGSDSFDALSRSYSYLFARPWRTGFYALVALIYGTFCYLFVRFFVYVLLKATHLAVGLGMFRDRPAAGEGVEKLDAIWASPTFESLMPDWSLLSVAHGTDWLAGVLIGVWVAIAASLVCAFLISFYFNGCTIAYLLLRREVDATDMDDVYVEEPEEPETPSSETPEQPAGESAPPEPGGEAEAPASEPSEAAPPPDKPDEGAGEPPQ